MSPDRSRSPLTPDAVLSSDGSHAASDPLAEARWVCGRIRDRLDAQRVAVWVLSDATGTLTPAFSVGAHDRVDGGASDRWARTPLDTVPLFEELIRLEEPRTVCRAEDDPRLPAQLVSDFAIDSVTFHPLITDRPVGVLSIEPAGLEVADDLRDLLRLLALTIGQFTSRRLADHQRRQAELLLELSEAAADSASLTETLTAICRRLAQHARVNRACLHFVEDGVARPRMASYADGHHDPEEWATFLSATGSIAITQQVLATGEVQTAEEPTSPLIAGWWGDTFGLGAALAVPVGTAPDITAVLVLDDPMPRVFPPELVRLVAAVGVQVATLISRAAAEEERAWHLRALSSTRSLLQEGAQARTVDGAGVLLTRVAADAFAAEHALFVHQRDGMITDLTTVGVDATVEAELRAAIVGGRFDRWQAWHRTITDGRPLLGTAPGSEDLPAVLRHHLGSGSFVVLPLASADAPIGVVHLTGGSRTWRAHHRTLARQLILEAKLVVDNALLRQQDQERLEELAHSSTHDALTGLPNRALFAERLEQAFKQPRLAKHRVGLLFLDLDRFKEINDTVGHIVADELLREVARRLRRSTRAEDTVARFAGDEFVILLPHAQGVRDVEEVAKRIATALSEPVVVDDTILHVTASAGIACGHPDSSDPDRLLRAADAAMFRVKRRGRGGYEIDRSAGPLG